MCLFIWVTAGASLSERMKRTLEAHSQQFTPLWEGFMGGECTPRSEATPSGKGYKLYN